MSITAKSIEEWNVASERIVLREERRKPLAVELEEFRMAALALPTGPGVSDAAADYVAALLKNRRSAPND